METGTGSETGAVPTGPETGAADSTGIQAVAISGKSNSGKSTLAANLKNTLGNDTMLLAFATPLKRLASVVFGCPAGTFDSRAGKQQRTAGDFLISIYKGKGVPTVVIIPAVFVGATGIENVEGLTAALHEVETRTHTAILRTLCVRQAVCAASLLQALGEAVREVFGGDFWGRILRKRMAWAAAGRPSCIFIITDLRYVDELEILRGMCAEGHRIVFVRIEGRARHDEVADTRDVEHPSEVGLDEALGWDIIFRHRPLSEINRSAQWAAIVRGILDR